MFTHNISNILSIALKEVIPTNQHGFYPGRGTLTAWKSLLSKIKSPNIYEFDLRSCFNNIEIGTTLNSLYKETQTTEYIETLLESISYSTPNFPSEIDGSE